MAAEDPAEVVARLDAGLLELARETRMHHLERSVRIDRPRRARELAGAG